MVARREKLAQLPVDQVQRYPASAPIAHWMEDLYGDTTSRKFLFFFKVFEIIIYMIDNQIDEIRFVRYRAYTIHNQK